MELKFIVNSKRGVPLRFKELYFKVHILPMRGLQKFVEVSL